MEDPQKLKEVALHAIRTSQSPSELETYRVQYLGRQGEVTQLMRGLGSLPMDKRRQDGLLFNAIKEVLAAEIAARAAELGRAALANRLAEERADVTLPVLTGGT